MEAISTSVPSINAHRIHPKTHHHHHLKPPLLHHHSHLSTSTTTVAGKPPTSISKTSKPKPPQTPSHHILQSTSQQSPPPRTHTHRNAATGYAAALIDAALSSNSLEPVHKDVKKLLKWLKSNEMLKGMMADPFVEEGVKGGVIKEVSEKAKLRRQVVAMVKMLVAKSKSGMVAQVMEEFERIYCELMNTSLPAVIA